MIVTMIKIVFLLGILILVHETAHFVTAKIFKVHVNEFSIGFGKTIYKREKNDTIYYLKLIPLGGYVNLKGLDEENHDSDSYTSVSHIKRMIIILSGSIINIIFGIIIYFILAFLYTDFMQACNLTGDFLVQIINSLFNLFTCKLSFAQFMGPIGISTLISSTHGVGEYVYLISLISVSLGITNLLPIPPLDGFKFLILLIEKIRRKDFSKKFEINIQFLGFILLFVLVIFITTNDILRIL